MSVENILDSPDPLLASCFFEKHQNSLVLVSGPSGSGKTTWCAGIVSQARDLGLSVGGILCPAVFERGKKVGIDQLDLSTGERRRLGVRSDEHANHTVGCWHMDASVLAWGNQIITGLKNEDVIIIDELGPLELEDGYGYQQALHLLDEGRYHTAFVVVRQSLLRIVKLRWPQAQTHSLEGMAI
jgi:nucleoside-triphosphatase THEP1